MGNRHGEWIWFELWTSDPDAAQAFYGSVLGWNAADAGMPEMDYRLFRSSHGEVAGLMPLPAEAAREGPAWLGYIGVDDVDAAAAAVEAASGTVHIPPTTLPGVGRMAMVADPQGVPFHVMRGESPEPSRAFRQCRMLEGSDTLGHAVWCELSSPDPAAAIDFHRRIFGWGQEGGLPMGDAGQYAFLQAGDVGFGAAMPVMLGGRKGWLFYFHVADIDAGVDRIVDGGGAVVQEPMQIPGGGWAMVARDPQGAAFGLVGARVQHDA